MGIMLVRSDAIPSFMPFATAESHQFPFHLDEEHVAGRVAVLEMTKAIGYVLRSLDEVIQIGVSATLYYIGENLEVGLST